MRMMPRILPQTHETAVVAAAVAAALFLAFVATAATPPARAPAAPPADNADVVITNAGDCLSGTVLAVEPGGKLHLKGPDYGSEIVIAPGATDAVALGGRVKETGVDQVALTNGDRIRGTLAEMSPDSLVINTQAAGRLKVPVTAVISIDRAGPENVLAETSFAAGRLEPWVNMVPPAWSLDDGALVCRGAFAERQPVYFKLDQQEAITMLAKVQTLQGANLRVDLAIYSDRIESDGRNCLIAAFSGTGARMIALVDGGSSQFAERNLAREFTAGELRVAYDPVAGKARMWMDHEDMGEYTVPVRLTDGQYVMFGSNVLLRVEYVKVLRGIVPPPGGDESPSGAAAGGPAPGGGIAVRFVNQDRVLATKISMADGQVTLTTPHGEITCRHEQLSRVVFGNKASAPPPGDKGSARILTDGGQMTLRLDRLTADQLVGHSEIYGGEVKLRRDGVREIKFNAIK
jgi:hypothetical protein